jgi:hypothetical protein
MGTGNLGSHLLHDSWHFLSAKPRFKHLVGFLSNFLLHHLSRFWFSHNCPEHAAISRKVAAVMLARMSARGQVWHTPNAQGEDHEPPQRW